MKAPLRPNARLGRMLGEGKASLMTTVLSSGVVIDVIGAAGETSFESVPRALPSALIFSQLNLMSSIVILRPLVGGRGSKAMSGRSLPVIVRPSGDVSYDASASPSTVVRGSSPLA